MSADNIDLIPLTDETVFSTRPRRGSAVTIAMRDQISVEAT